MVRLTIFFLANPFLNGCALEEYRNADLQLEILEPLPQKADQVRICVENIGFRSKGAGDNYYAMPGLPTDMPLTVFVQLIANNNVFASSIPVTMDIVDIMWESTLIEEQQELCVPVGEFAGDQEDSWLLVVRFQSF